MVPSLLIRMGAGAVSGIIAAVLGYAKNIPKGEEFDEGKFVQTVIVGGIVGACAGEMGLTYEQAYDWAASIGLVTLIEYMKKMVWRAIHRD
jgi:hypothetical protein